MKECVIREHHTLMGEVFGADDMTSTPELVKKYAAAMGRERKKLLLADLRRGTCVFKIWSWIGKRNEHVRPPRVCYIKVHDGKFSK